MKKIYAPITSEQFNQLYRFGELFIPQFLSIESEDDVSNIQSGLLKLFISYLPFIYDEDYLVIKGDAIFQEEQKQLHLKIIDIENIYPISDQCAKALILKKPIQINFSDPVFSLSQLSEINDAFFLSEARKGANCLWSIFKSKFSFSDFSNDKFEEIYDAALAFRKNKKIHDLKADLSIVYFAFAYVYQAYYPLTHLGYFFRTVEILTRKTLLEKGIAYHPSILEGTEIYKLLEEIKLNNPDIELKEIIEILEKNGKAIKFINTLLEGEVRYYIVIPAFLFIIDEFNSKQSLENIKLEGILKTIHLNYPKECQLLILWVAAYLGYGNCYDYSYSKSNLKFFKGFKATEPRKDEELKKEILPEVNTDLENNNTVKYTTIDDSKKQVETRDEIEQIFQNESDNTEIKNDYEANPNYNSSQVTEIVNNEIQLGSVEEKKDTSNYEINKTEKELYFLIEKALSENHGKVKIKDAVEILKTNGITTNGKNVTKSSLKSLLKKNNYTFSIDDEYIQKKIESTLFNNEHSV
jgi:hypothetical protein